MSLARALLWTAWLAACGAEDPGHSLRVGSKAFTESVILAEIATQTARAAGTPSVHRHSLGGTRLIWNALVAGEIDLYPDYTGTLFAEILRDEGASRDGRALAAALQARGLGAIGPLGFENNYALGMREPRAAELGIETISQLADHPELRFGFSSEFMNRQDGWPRLRERYGLPQRDVRGLDHDVAYRGLASDALDVIDLYTTDAEIPYYHIRLLTDDRGHFASYEAILVYRLSAARRFARAFAALGGLTRAISPDAMRAMNGRAKLARESEARIAADFVSKRSGRAMLTDETSRPQAVLRHVREHISLVALSLGAAILLAIPLGVLAFRLPAFGQLALGAVGVIQTIPSLALLVFMVPLLGLGALPTIVALFLYSLLPIVRNTHAGLASVPPSIRESAEAMGLSNLAILRLVDLPMASRAILAGVKSAAVINVGTATLGALVGAGGLGEPIFTGVRLDDLDLILSGAVPASLLALAVQGAFDLLERLIVPRGLRLKRAT